MKKILLSPYGICAILAMGILFGCSKDKNDDTPSNRILGLWNIIRETEINKNTTTGKYTDTSFSDPLAAGIWTAEFRGNGKVYFNLNSNPPRKDTADWHFHNDSTLYLKGISFQLSEVNNNHMIATEYYWDNTDSVKRILEYSK